MNDYSFLLVLALVLIAFSVSEWLDARVERVKEEARKLKLENDAMEEQIETVKDIRGE
jgi:hypothetical protein